MAHILVVEDDFDIRELLQNFLEAAGHTVSCAADGAEGIACFHEHTYDLVLLDILLPRIDGFTVLELIRRGSEMPVIMLSALDGEEHQLRGYDLQVDDYLTKPFSMKILLHKVGAVLRRTAGTESGALLTCYRDLTVDRERRRAVLGTRELPLTLKEFELLCILLDGLGKVLTRQQLLDLVWGYDYFGDDRVVDTHIKNLRKKLPTGYIETIRGVGYRIDKVDTED